MITTVTPFAFMAWSARIRACSPSASRLAFGSSSTTSRGSPYSARARPMRWRWPPDSSRPRPLGLVALGQAQDQLVHAGALRGAHDLAPESGSPRRAMFSATVPANSSTSWGR